MKKTKYNSALPLMLFFFLGIMMSIPCEAQNTIYKHPACNSETSLIRYYKKNVDIRVELWVIDPWGNYSQSCSYVDRATGNAYTFYFPSYCVISDFEILNGNVYFCGNDLSGSSWDLSTAMHWLYDVNNPNDCITIGNIPIQDLQRNQYNINLTQYPNDVIITWRDYPVRIIPSNIL